MLLASGEIVECPSCNSTDLDKAELQAKVICQRGAYTLLTTVIARRDHDHRQQHLRCPAWSGVPLLCTVLNVDVGAVQGGQSSLSDTL